MRKPDPNEVLFTVFQQTEVYTVPITKKWWQFWIPSTFSFANRRFWKIDGGLAAGEAFATIMTNKDPEYQGTDVNLLVKDPTLQVVHRGEDNPTEEGTETGSSPESAKVPQGSAGGENKAGKD